MTTMTRVTMKQLELAERLFGEATLYARLLKAYTMWASVNLCQRHSTHDSIFFIIDEGIGFKTIKFYNDGIDMRISGYVPSLAEAYNEAVHTL